MELKACEERFKNPRRTPPPRRALLILNALLLRSAVPPARLGLSAASVSQPSTTEQKRNSEGNVAGRRAVSLDTWILHVARRELHGFSQTLENPGSKPCWCAVPTLSEFVTGSAKEYWEISVWSHTHGLFLSRVLQTGAFPSRCSEGTLECQKHFYKCTLICASLFTFYISLSLSSKKQATFTFFWFHF